MAAWLSGYTTRRRIVISHANVDADLTAFPVYVRLRSTNFNFAESTSNGHDVRFTADDGTTLLNFERERHDQGAVLADYVVRIPTLFGAVDTVIFMYFQTTTAPDLSAPNTVWDANTVGRWSLAENPAGTAPQMRDSTANNNHGTTEGSMTAGQSVEGAVGRALGFDGVNDRVNINRGLTPQFTISGKVRLPNFASKLNNTFYDVTPHTSLTVSLNRMTANGNISVFIGNGTSWHGTPSITSSVNMTQNQWHRITVTCDGTTTRLYLDATERGSSAHIPSGWGSSFRLGDLTHITAREYLLGQMDDFSISNIVRSPAWIKALFHSGNNTLLTVQATEVPINSTTLAMRIAVPTRIRSAITTPTNIQSRISSQTRIKSNVTTAVGLSTRLATATRMRSAIMTTVFLSSRNATPTRLMVRLMTPTNIQSRISSQTRIKSTLITTINLSARIATKTRIQSNITPLYAPMPTNISVRFTTPTRMQTQIQSTITLAARISTKTRITSNIKLLTPISKIKNPTYAIVKDSRTEAIIT